MLDPLASYTFSLIFTCSLRQQVALAGFEKMKTRNQRVKRRFLSLLKFVTSPKEV